MKTQHKYKTILIPFILAIILIGTSCNQFLTQEPISDLTVSDFWKTPNDAKVGVIAIYSDFSKALASGLWDWGELRSDNFISVQKESYDQKELISNNIQIDNNAALWTNLYSTIQKANAAIKYIPRIAMTVSEKNSLLAEAYTLRAWSYFYCVRVWGDVPLYTDPVESVEQGIYKKRTDKQIILNLILTDLDNAYLLIDKTLVDRSRVNVATICVLMMDVNAWLHNYDLVVKINEEKVSNLSSTKWGMTALTAATFTADWRAMFIEDPLVAIPKEDLFKLSYDQLGNGENYAIKYFSSSEPYVNPSSKLMSIYGVKDLRKVQWEKIDAVTYILDRKFWKNGTIFSGTGKIFSDNDLVLYRYADIVLLYAEALNAIDRKADAVNALNITRVRAGESAYLVTDFLSSDDLLDAILLERQKEFLGEGKRWFDLVRTNRWQQVMYPINGMNDSRKILFPIHRNHLIQNPELVQNPGY